jgi:hypothetical protein
MFGMPPAEQVEDKSGQKDRPGTDGSPPNSVGEVMHIRADHPGGDGGCYQECREDKNKTQ